MDESFREILIRELLAQHNVKDASKQILFYDKNEIGAILSQVDGSEYIIVADNAGVYKEGWQDALVGWLQEYPETEMVGYYGYILRNGFRFYGKYENIDGLEGVFCFKRDLWEKHGCPSDVTVLCNLVEKKYCLNVEYFSIDNDS